MRMPTTESARTRPRDRKRQIEEAAALAFAERGYHRVSMGDVASAVGISGPALYRHFPNKYALFVQSAFRVAHSLLEVTDEISSREVSSGEGATEQLRAMIDALVRNTIELRAVGGIYRWEGRYLLPDDRARLSAEFVTLRSRFAVRLAILRPGEAAEDVDLAVWAALSAIASITAHRGVLAASALQALLRDAAWRALLSPVARIDADVAGGAPAGPTTPPTAHRRTRLVAEAIALFAARGYHDVTIEEIASAVDLTASGVYRHFDGKASILLEACEQAAAQLDEGVQRAHQLARSDGAVAALHELAGDYVHRMDANHRLMRVYFADVSNLDSEDQRRLRALQRTYVEQWVTLLTQARPELNAREAAFLVHAGFSVVADLLTRAHVRRVRAAGQTTQALKVVLGIA